MKTNIIQKHTELEEVITNCEVCYVSMVDKDGKPYVLPFNFAYDGNKIYLHSGNFGKKLEILKVNPDVCIAFSLGHKLFHQHETVACSYSMLYKSVIVSGKVEFEEDIQKKTDIMNKVMMKYTGKTFEFSKPAISNVSCFVVNIIEISGRNRGM